jgi:GMP synthase-like glutamine amidotransferase
MLTVVQLDPEVPLGAYAGYLQGMKIPFRTITPFAGEELPAAAELAAIIVLGGAMSVHDTAAYPFLLTVKEFIAGAVAHGVPFFGICLGGQLLADVCGGVVTTGSPCGEKGTLPVSLTDEGVGDPLFFGVAREFMSFQWHNDSFAIPEAGIRLATSAACPNQAFRYGARAYGSQFHPEVDAAIVETWSSWTDETAPLTDRFLADFAAHAFAYRTASRLLLQNFLRIAALR